MDDDRSLAISDASGVMVCEHLLGRPGEVSVRAEHYGAPRRAVRPRTQQEKDFCALGPIAEAFISGAAAAGNTRLGVGLRELNQLHAAHGEDEFVEALSRAFAVSRWRAGDVRLILAAGRGTAQPRPVVDALVLDLPLVPTRSLAPVLAPDLVEGLRRLNKGRHRRR